ncbi:hypothetical protein GCM10011376_06970 [Nocardioides flavus (ex Wang et al. 2016)]|uniref:Integral membrane protein n=1 Tax=Nocardioides flavus (ex Wang et al. 2016) TaxID=2058780 RepID=A0ABQ3HHF6_9ACTN|nr:hypothetical protein [Nocardioides flavus (ex Wang et al. 2016)]GHE16013.1 hypothetical protein GCM10011376_06970 [Nocardioides flavus (ex Wang et al. 2016)]
MSSPSSGSPRGSSRGKRAAERPPSRLRRTRRAGSSGDRTEATDVRMAAPAPAPAASPPPAAGPPATPAVEAPAATPAAAPAEVLTYGPRRWVLAFWFLVLVLGAAALGWSAVTGIFSDRQVISDLTPLPEWFDGAGAVAVATALSWLLATRTAGRALISAGLALALGVAAVVVGGRVLPTGAAVMTCVVGSVYAVMVTVPAVTGLKAMREACIAALVATVTAFAAVGFEPTVATERFEIVTLLLALALVLAIVYRLGAGLHGLGRRGMIVVAIGLGVLFATLAYAELLRRYGAQSFVSSVLDFADWTSARIGAFPRPLVVLLGIPALVWGTHVRARRRQGWWFCAFGVAATVPLATGLVSPDSSYLEAGLRAAYSLVLGLVLGYLVIRADLALTGPKGKRGRRAEEAGPHRPEPRRFAEL